MALNNIKMLIIKHYQRISDLDAYVTEEMVRKAYQEIGSEYETLIKAFDKDLKMFGKHIQFGYDYRPRFSYQLIQCEEDTE